jgi:hypothetical protein
VEEIGPVDIALLETANPELTGQIDPWIMVVEKGSDLIAVPKLSITADKLPTETQTVVLERKG